MKDFFNWLTAGDSGLAADRLADQFRLSQAEMRQTAEALAPAFALGLQRAMSDPMAQAFLGRSLAAMAPKHGLPDWDTAAGPAGHTLVESLFGSKALAGAVSRQASMVTGLAPDTIEKLMPSLAVLTIENLMRWSLAHAAAGRPNPFDEQAVGGAVAEMMRRGANAVEAFSRPSGTGAVRRPSPPEDLGSIFADALRGASPWAMFAAQSPGRSEAKTPAPPPGSAAPAANPFMALAPMFEAFARGLQPAKDTPEPEPEPDPPKPDSPESADLRALIGDMVQTGQRLGEGYSREMAALFDRYAAKPASSDGAKPSP